MGKIHLMISGIPGNMAVTVARQALADKRFDVLPTALTGPEITVDTHDIDGVTFELIRPARCNEAIAEIKTKYGPVLVIDFTHPTAVNDNAAFFCNHGLPFVMGTTGGDRQQLYETVTRSAVPAVIAPNMAKQIVGFQAMMAYAADNFPDLFNGYALEIRESHQQGKADTSGTAKAMVAYFNRLGLDFSVEQIQKERDPERQLNVWGVPEAHLAGHGWHTYRLHSADRSVLFEFRHNVNGRDIYAGGTLDAATFLAAKASAGIRGKVYSMIDVLRG